MTAQLTDAGLILDTTAGAFAALQARVRSLFDGDLVITQDSTLGKLLIVFAEAAVANQQFLATVADALALSQSTGVQLINLGELNGVQPLGATRSTIPLKLGGAPGLDVGDKRVRYNPTGAIFRTPVGTTLLGGTALVTGVAEETGPVLALTGDASVWTIVDGVSGWTAASSTGDALVGRAAESQEEFRTRAQQAAKNNGAATEPATEEALAAVDGVTKVRVLNNRGPIVDADGVAGFTVEAIFTGGEAPAIGLALFYVLGLSTPTQGDEVVQVTDPIDGEVSPFYFSRSKVIRVVYRITLDTAGAEKPLDEDAVGRVVAAVVGYTDALGDGIDVVPTVAAALALAALTPGTVTGGLGEAARFGAVVSPATLQINKREITTTFGTAQAAVTVAAVEPYNLIAGENLDLAIDGSTVVSAVFAVEDFAVISAATAAEVAAVINTALGNALVPGVASSAALTLVISSTSTGASSSVSVVGSTAPTVLTALGLVVGVVTGTNTDVEVIFT